MRKTVLLSSKIVTCTLSLLFFFTAIFQTNAQSAKKYYYDPSKYKTYLEQLGITYPTVEKK